MKQARLSNSDEDPPVLAQLELAKAEKIASHIEASIKPLCDKTKVVGSIRRKKPFVGDCDFVVLAADGNWTRIVHTLRKSEVICAGPSLIKLNYPAEEGLFQADFYRATSPTFGIQELIRTGSADHNMWLASYALIKGFRLKYSSGLLRDEVVVAGETEESVFESLGLPCTEPEQREVLKGKPIWLKNNP